MKSASLPVRLRRLGAGLLASPAREHSATQPRLCVCIGTDADDEALAGAAAALQRCFPPGVPTALRTFTDAELAEQRGRCGGAAPLCWMWSELAAFSQSCFGPCWTLLLGDDVTVEPAGWPAVLAEFVAQRPHLRCTALLDAADPGFPSFLAVSPRHLEVFGRVLPEQLLNQGGDPLLYDLYRSFGTAAVCPDVVLINAVGGPAGTVFPGPAAGAAAEPRYSRCPLSVHQWRAALRSWQAALAAEQPQLRRRMQVAVAVPSYRVNSAALSSIFQRSTAATIPDADVRMFVVVDNPGCSKAALAWLRSEQQRRLDGLRVRLSAANQGAAGARNALLDEAAACDLVVLFDDDVEPSPGAVAAYVQGYRDHPEAAGLAGPTYLERRPSELLPTAIHMSDVSFFWEAPASGLLGKHVPWAVSANMAVPYTGLRFRPGFPRTGGGEDVDFCVQLGARLVAVPEAAATHPWWPERRPKIYGRFWGWAAGDGRLIELWPSLAYRRAPNPAELCLLLVAVAPALMACGLASARALACCLPAVLATDLLISILRNCCLPARRRQHPCASWLRPLAAAEAFVIVTLASEGGRLVGHLKRGSWGCLCRSFDWFCGSQPAVVAGEQRRATLRAGCCLAAAAAWLCLSH
ncbi:hypothetical protein ABPG75_003416 [Micractinium tetrahymenae]